MTSTPTIDLTNCDREPIHIPGSIQPHGMMLVLDEPELHIRQASDNAADRVGLSGKSLLGKPLAEIMSLQDVEYLRRKVLNRTLDQAPHYLPTVHLGRDDAEFEGIIHRQEGALILELEQWPEKETTVQEEIYGALKSAMAQLDRATSVVEFCQNAAERVKDFIGFDRVMVYRFAEEGSGHVIAEARRPDLESYLGLHYPAADIPKQARELFKRSQLRLNPDVRYLPVPITPSLRPDTGGPLDMSYCVTRSMSPIHAEYLQNMGVHASMSISIVVNDELWGLFACHHYAPRYVPHSTRMACEFLAHMLSLQVASKESNEQHEYAASLYREHQQIVSALDTSLELTEALNPLHGQVLGGIRAEGAALVFNHKVHRYGQAPDDEAIRCLTRFLGQEVDDASDRVTFRRHLTRGASQLYEVEEVETARGALAALGMSVPDCVLINFNLPETDGLSFVQPVVNSPERMPLASLC